MLSEEEIIKTIKNFDKETKKVKEERSPYDEIKFKKILIHLSEEHYSIFADLLDLYNKGKEKNKELTEELMGKELIIDGMKEDRRIAIEEIREEYYVSKDKLKAILGIEEDISEERLLSLLETLMSEVDRLEDIEDRKVQIEYNNVFNKGVKSVEDKIREKIEEYNKQRQETGNSIIYTRMVDYIDCLQELLEESK